MTERKFTCIICPSGCEITVIHDEGKIISVVGNTCKRGEKYVQTELTSPMRTLTTTVMSQSGKPIAVKTASPIPKSMLFECMKAANSVTVPDGVKSGDTVIKDICSTGADLIVTSIRD